MSLWPLAVFWNCLFALLAGTLICLALLLFGAALAALLRWPIYRSQDAPLHALSVGMLGIASLGVLSGLVLQNQYGIVVVAGSWLVLVTAMFGRMRLAWADWLRCGISRETRMMVLGAGLSSLTNLLVFGLPLTEWDSWMYHLGTAERMAKGQIWAVDAFVQQTNYPALVHELYGLIGQGISIPAAISFHLVVSCFVLGLSVQRLAIALGGSRAGLLAVPFFCAQGLFFSYARSLMVDAFLSCAAVWATLAVLEMKETERKWIWPAFWVACSLLLGAKSTAVLILPVLLVMLVWALWGSGMSRLRHSLRSATLAGFILIPGAFWYGRNAWLLGDALYPHGPKIFWRNALNPINIAADLLVDVPAKLLQDSEPVKDLLFLKSPTENRTLLNSFSFFEVDSSLAMHSGLSINPAFLLAVFGLFAGGSLGVLSGVWLIGLAALSPVAHALRYVMPHVAVLDAVAAAAVIVGLERVAWLRNFQASKAGRWTTVLLFLGLFVLPCGLFGISQLRLLVQSWPWVVAAPTGATLEGVLASTDPDNALQGIAQIAVWMKEQRPQLSVRPDTLCLWESRGRIFERGLADHNTMEGQRWVYWLKQARGDDEEFRKILSANGIRFVVSTERILRFNINAFYYQEPLRRNVALAYWHAEKFLGKYSRLIHEDGGVKVYELTVPAAAQ